jgi:hypothetical protein
LWINDVVYAELSVRHDRIEQLNAFLDAAAMELPPIPRLSNPVSGQPRCAAETGPSV